MKRILSAEATAKRVRLHVEYEEYERYAQGKLRRANITGSDLLDALKKMVDRMGLYLDSDEIEEEGMTAEEVINSIDMSNGDGCDFIYILKNVDTGEVYIHSDYDYDDEEQEW